MSPRGHRSAWGALVVPICIALSSAPAFAQQLNLVIDGDLTDLIAAIQDNPAVACTLSSGVGTNYTQSCGYTNGYDITAGYLLFHFRAGPGDTSEGVDLYAAWQVAGIIGDYDGDGNPDVFSSPQGTCATAANESGTNRNGRTGISSNESYCVQIDDCFGFNAFAVRDNRVISFVTGDPIPNATYARSGSTLELHIPNVHLLLPALGNCAMTLILSAVTEFSGMGNDHTSSCTMLATAEGGVAPGLFRFLRPLPNPFSQVTRIPYALDGSRSEVVRIGVYDVAGRLVRTLVDAPREPGRYQTSWDGRDADGSQVNAGAYWMRAYISGIPVTFPGSVIYIH